MRHMADRGQGLAAKAKRCNAVEVLKLAQLAGREAFAHDAQVFLLLDDKTGTSA